MPVHDCVPPDGGRVWCKICFQRLPWIESLHGVGFAFPWGGGGKEGRDTFHGPTLKERQERQLHESAKAGLDPPEPVGKRWV